MRGLSWQLPQHAGELIFAHATIAQCQVQGRHRVLVATRRTRAVRIVIPAAAAHTVARSGDVGIHQRPGTAASATVRAPQHMRFDLVCGMRDRRRMLCTAFTLKPCSDAISAAVRSSARIR